MQSVKAAHKTIIYKILDKNYLQEKKGLLEFWKMQKRKDLNSGRNIYRVQKKK